MQFQIGKYIFWFKGRNQNNWFTLIREVYDNAGNFSHAYAIFQIIGFNNTMKCYCFHHQARPNKQNPNYTRIWATSHAKALEKFNTTCENQDKQRPPLIYGSFIHLIRSRS